jgi:predicted transglutaminase-like cysteine proteinase
MLRRLAFAAAINFAAISLGYAYAPLATAPSDSESGAAATFVGKAPIPSGYFQLCSTSPEACQLNKGSLPTNGEGVLVSSPAILQQLASVNSAVNRAIRPVADIVQYHVEDRWSVEPKRGDCEDYALTKKARLIGLGWPSGALLLAVAATSRNEEHVVLIVRTDEGDFVLDNLAKQVRRWSLTLYRWKAVQIPNEIWGWARFGDGTVRYASRRDAGDSGGTGLAESARQADFAVARANLAWAMRYNRAAQRLAEELEAEKRAEFVASPKVARKPALISAGQWRCGPERSALYVGLFRQPPVVDEDWLSLFSLTGNPVGCPNSGTKAELSALVEIDNLRGTTLAWH